MRSMQSDISVDAPAWACHQLEMGQDTPHLRILAGLGIADGRWEIEATFDQALRELNLTLPFPDRAATIYAVELAQGYLDGTVQREFLLRTLCQMCIDTDYTRSLTPFYNLRWSWDDLKKQGWSFYDLKATKENFDDILVEAIENLKNTIG